MGAKDSSDGVCARVLCTNVVIKTIVPSIKIREINVDTVDGSEFKVKEQLLCTDVWPFLGSVFGWG